MNKKRILSALLTLCLVVGMVLGAQMSVSAATTTGVKITFNGKSITLDTDWESIIRGTSSEPKTLAAVEKKWGKKTRLAKQDEMMTDADYAYVWEKGKSKIVIGPGYEFGANNIVYKDFLGFASIESTDKNVTVAGVKVGMKRATAVKKLRSIYGKKNVVQLKEGQYPKLKNGAYVAAGKATGTAYTEISVVGPGIQYTLKGGKVSGIGWMRIL